MSCKLFIITMMLTSVFKYVFCNHSLALSHTQGDLVCTNMKRKAPLTLPRAKGS